MQLPVVCERIENRIWVVKECSRGGEFSNPSLVEHKYSRIVHDCGDAMRDGDDRAVGEMVSDGGLNEGVRFHVNGRCSFVQHEDPSLSSEKGPGQAEELFLAVTQVGAALLHRLRQSIAVTRHEILLYGILI